MRKLNYSLVDVFTERPLMGNPLAVFTLTRELPDAVMQRLAREMNLSETAFVTPTSARSTARLRIFTPVREVPFAGHPVVGSAYVIARSTPLGLLRFETGAGLIEVVIEREGGFVSKCVMAQPAPAYRDVEVDAALLRAAIGVAPSGAVREGSNGPTFLLVPVDDVDAVRPDMGALARLPPVGVYERPRGRVTRQRLFAPTLGVPEDPVTGSLAGLVAQRLLLDGLVEPGELTIHQGEQVDRPGVVWTHVSHEWPPRVGGACASVARGTVEIPV